MLLKMKDNKVFTLMGMILAMLLASLDQMIVSTAMPQIVRELNGIEHLSWVFTAYMLASAVSVPIFGKLSDLFGRKRLYIISISIFLVGSIFSGMSQSMTQLILFRAIQGIGGGAIMVNSFAMIGEIFPPAERGKFQGMMGGIFGLSSIAGPLLGGWITDNASWRWVFYVNIPVGLIALVVIIYSLPSIRHVLKSKKIDYLGSALLTIGIVPLLLALVWGGNLYPWNSPEIIGFLVTAVVAITAFIFAEKKAVNPILSLDLFRNKIFVVSCIAIFFSVMGMYGTTLYIPIFAQSVTGASATHSGLILTPMMMGLIFSSSLSGLLISKTGKYKILAILGMAVAMSGMFFFSTIGPETTNSMLVVRMIVLGLGLGITMPIFTLAVQSAFPPNRLGEVTAGTQLFRNIGGTVGTAILGGFMNSQMASRLNGFENDPFISSMQKMNPALADKKIDMNMAQGFLSPDAGEKVKGMIAHLPDAIQSRVSADYTRLIEKIKIAYSQSLDNVFLVSAALLGAGLIAVFFLAEIPLRKRNVPVMEEVGLELEDELGSTHAEPISEAE
jgi:EmrB/QacA subfamily drug resistance transporter